MGNSELMIISYGCGRSVVITALVKLWDCRVETMLLSAALLLIIVTFGWARSI